MNVRTINYLFALLAFVAAAAAIASWVLVVAARRRDALASRLHDDLGSGLRWFALAIAVVATAGSLYYSEIRHFLPCELCWLQRDLMYPLVVVLLVGTLRRDRSLGWYVLPFVVLGPLVSGYHMLVENVSWFQHETTCGKIACSAPYFRVIFPFVTLAFMALAGFLAIGGLIALDAVLHREDDERVARAGGSVAMRVVALVAVTIPALVGLYQTQIDGLLPLSSGEAPFWYARVALYPIVLVLVVALVRRDRDVAWYAVPFVAVTIVLVVPHLIGGPATEPGRWWGWLALGGAVVAGAALVADIRQARDTPTPIASDDNGPTHPPTPPDLEVTR